MSTSEGAEQVAWLGEGSPGDLLDQRTRGELQSVSSSDYALQPLGSGVVEVVPPNPYPSQANAPVHPALLYFKSGLWGYRYGMAFTTYPGSDSTYENPSVVASNDLQTWVALESNPLVAKPSGGSNYNADPHIFMAPANSRMYLAYRDRIIGGNNNIKVMHTSDGVNWSAPVTIISGAQGSVDYGSPSIWWNGTGWTMIRCVPARYVCRSKVPDQ